MRSVIDGAERIGVLSDPKGAFELTVPSAVDGVLRVERIGYASWRRSLDEVGTPELTVVMAEVHLDTSDRVCTTDVRRSVEITVIDDVTGEALGVRAQGYVRDGSFIDSLTTYRSRDGVIVSYAAGRRAPRLVTRP